MGIPALEYVSSLIMMHAWGFLAQFSGERRTLEARKGDPGVTES